jgi:mRNA degradation ribonuclease J1/J2
METGLQPMDIACLSIFLAIMLSVVKIIREPYNEEQELSQERIDSWIKHFAMAKYQSHCSGHAREKDLIEVVAQIGSKITFPIHTEYPELYQREVSNIKLVKEIEKYYL